MRTSRQATFYLVGTSRAKIREYEKQWLELPWQKVRGSVEVKLFARDGELYVLAKSEGRQAKEMAIRRKKLARLLRKLRAMRRSCPKRDQLLMRVGAAKTDAGRAFGFVKINRPQADQEVTRETFTFQLDKAKLKEAELRDGHYLLRTNLASGGRSSRVVGSLCATDADRSGVQMPEERSGRPADPPSTGATGGGAHPGCLPRLLSDGDAEASAAGARSRTDSPGSVGKTGRYSNAGRNFSDYRWPPTGPAALHRTESRAGTLAPSSDPRPAATTASAHHAAGLVSRLSPTQNVVETLAVPLLKTMHIPGSDLPNCEGSVRMRSQICGHVERSNTAAHHQLGVLRILNRGGHPDPDPRQLLGPCAPQNGGNGKALVTNRELGAENGCRSRGTIAAKDALTTRGATDRLPHFGRNCAPLRSKLRPISRRNRAPPLVEIAPHFDRNSYPDTEPR